MIIVDNMDHMLGLYEVASRSGSQPKYWTTSREFKLDPLFIQKEKTYEEDLVLKKKEYPFVLSTIPQLKR